jgi:hypothetical protein
MRLANALARFVELAGGNEAPLPPAVAEQLALSFG